MFKLDTYFELELSDRRYKYGKSESGIEFFKDSDLLNWIESTEQPEEQF